MHYARGLQDGINLFARRQRGELSDESKRGASIGAEGGLREAPGGVGAPCDHSTILLIEATNQTETT